MSASPLPPPSPPCQPSAAVSVCAPARLHLGFVDLHGGLGRRYGSIGLCIKEPATELILRSGDRGHSHGRVCAHGPDAERALRYAKTLLSQLGAPSAAELNLDIRVHRAIPAHAGLGSGTQLALAVGTALGQLLGQPLTATEIAAKLGRGARSGIGVGAFEQGGFIVDGGHAWHADSAAINGTEVPPLLCRLAVPQEWRLLLICDSERHGVHGAAEHGAFAHLPPFSDAEAGVLCRLVLMQLLPALSEADLATFGDAVTEIQRRVGDYFAPLQGGTRFTSPAVAKALDWLLQAGAAGAGQSSWGPTGFALCADQTTAQTLHDELSARLPQLQLTIVAAQNTPARIETQIEI